MSYLLEDLRHSLTILLHGERVGGPFQMGRTFNWNFNFVESELEVFMHGINEACFHLDVHFGSLVPCQHVLHLLLGDEAVAVLVVERERPAELVLQAAPDQDRQTDHKVLEKRRRQ